MFNNNTDPFRVKILMIYEEVPGNTAVARAIKALRSDLEADDVKVIVSESFADGEAVIKSDPAIQCVLLKVEEKDNQCCNKALKVLDVIRSRNHNLPFFLMAGRRDASEVPVDILD